jgi:hypothetical protein
MVLINVALSRVLRLENVSPLTLLFLGFLVLVALIQNYFFYLVPLKISYEFEDEHFLFFKKKPNKLLEL